MSETTTNKTREPKTIPTTRLEQHLERTGQSIYEFSEQIGHARSTGKGWLNAGRMPEYMDHVLSGLEPPEIVNLIVAGDPETIKLIETTAARMGATTMRLDF